MNASDTKGPTPIEEKVRDNHSRPERPLGAEAYRRGPADARSRIRTLISPADVGQANRGRVLEALFDLGPTSRAELARYVGVNRATITGIVQPLLDGGLLIESDPLPSGEAGGKRARPLKFSAQAPSVVGVELMPGFVRSALVSWNGDILAEKRKRFRADASRAEPVLEVVEACIAAVLADLKEQALGIGVAVGGMVDTGSGTIVKVNLAPVLSGLPLGRLLTQRFGIPSCLDHHPRAMLLGDRWFGVGRGVRNFAAIYTGEVLGGALLLDGHLYRGPHGAGGELGHTFVQVDGEVCRCGRRGCWETIATLGWLRRRAAEARLADPDKINAGRLAALAGQSPAAAKLLDRYARNIAIGIANLQQTMASTVFVLHGDAVGGGEALRTAIEGHVRAMVPEHPGGRPQIALGDPEDRATLRGAAGLILSQELQFVV